MDTIKLWLDLSKEYGIILEGGSAKGVYQVGAWCALREVGIRIKGAAGTSVGALNDALICMDDFEKTERIWENTSYSRVMDVDDEFMERLGKFSLKDISSLVSLNVGEFITGAIWVLRDGGLDITPPRTLIEDVVDEGKIRDSDRELYVVTYSISDRHPLIANVKEVPEGAVVDLLVTSAYPIGSRQERLGGKYYMDDDGINNVLVDVLLDRGYKDMIVMCTYGYGVNMEKKPEVPGGVNLYRVASRRDLDGLLEFDRRRARGNMLLGYLDGKRMLYSLTGCVYYIDVPEGEPYYFDKMTSEIQSLLSYMKPELETVGEVKTEWEVQEEIIAGYRVYTEQIFPRLTKELELEEGRDYKELYLSILEDLARQYCISRLKVCTVEESLRLIHKKAGIAASKAMVPVLDSGTQV